MTVLRLADAGEAADLAAFLARLIHYDRAAAVRLQAGGGSPPHPALAVFGRPPSFDVLAVRTARLAGPEEAGEAAAERAAGGLPLDVTVSAGRLLDGVAELEAAVTVPAPVTGPPWAGMLPPRGGWRRLHGLPGTPELGAALAAAVREFRHRDQALPPEQRTRAARDHIGRDIWSRTLGDTPLPLRAAHAAQALGFLRPARTPAPDAAASGETGAAAGAAAPHAVADTPAASTPYAAAHAVPEAEERVTADLDAPDSASGQVALFATGGWLRLRTPYGAVALRTGGPAQLGLSPV